MIEVREEDAESPASAALWDEYLALVRARLGQAFEPTQEIFATAGAFAGPGAAWVVLYDDGVAVACGGMRPLEPGVAELKRMFVTGRARGQGHGRRLLAELECRAADAGHRRIRLLTTDVLAEARALYAAAGYREVAAPREGDRQDYWLEKEV